MRTCAATGCNNEFEPYRSWQLYCEPRCQHNEKARRQYRSASRYEWLEAHAEELRRARAKYKRRARRKAKRYRSQLERAKVAGGVHGGRLNAHRIDDCDYALTRTELLRFRESLDA